VSKLEYYKAKFGEERVEPMLRRMGAVFGQLGFRYSMGGLTGNTLDSHRLLVLAARQGLDRQNALAEELFLNYFTQEKYIGDRQVLLAAAEKAGVTGAQEWLDDPKAGLQEVQEELRTYGRGVSGVPHFRIGKLAVSGAQPPEVLVEALEEAAAAAA
jgi:predicted DsbA family dithiol-disulfide isomerase